jgi:hypothetical protein
MKSNRSCMREATSSCNQGDFSADKVLLSHLVAATGSNDGGLDEGMGHSYEYKQRAGLMRITQTRVTPPCSWAIA